MAGRRMLQGALLAVVLVGGVLLGLLGMHALDTHGTGGHATGGHGVSTSASVSGPSPVAHPAVAYSQAASVAPADPTDGGGAACVLALLGGLLLLLRHPGSVVFDPVGRPRRSPRAAATARPRPPSLHVLCISRT